MAPEAAASGLRFGRWVSLAFSLAVSGVGVAFIGIGTFEWTRAADSVAWPTVPGTVVESRIVETTSSHRGRASRSHAARIVYRYRVGDREFEASRVSFRVQGGGRDAARATVDAFPAGGRVEVRHSPADPAVACLVPGTDEWQSLPIGVGTLAIAFAVAFWWFVRRTIERRLAGIAGAR